jgi:tetratricopeptide (TPR) repeat protein/transcriptional regulator with XRE-family HTH domain
MYGLSLRGASKVTDPSPETFGEKLERLRKERFLSRQALADASGVGYGTIRDLEHRSSQAPRLSTIKSLADALGLHGTLRSEFETAALEHARHYQRKGGRDSTQGTEDTEQSAAANVPVARTLPRDIGSFTGRDAEMRKLLDGARDAARAGVAGLFVIEGMGGVGKTTLAVHAAHTIIAEHPGQFPDGHIFLDLRGYSNGPTAVTAHHAMRSLLRMLNVPVSAIPDQRAAREQLYQSTVAEKSALIILDNARNAAQVRPLLPGTARCMVVVTSRESLRSLDDAKVLALGTPSEAEAIALFRAVAGADRAASDDAALTAQIVRLCGHLPLAVRIVAARLSRRPALQLANVLDELRAVHSRLVRLQDDDRSVTAVFETSLRHLDDLRERRLFKQLGLIPGQDFDICTAASLSGATFGVTRLRLESLLDHNLLIQRTAGRYQFHDLVRVFARSLPVPDEARATDNLMNYYLYTARTADRAFERGLPRADTAAAGIRPGSLSQPAAVPRLQTSAQAQAWLSAEAVNLYDAARFAARNGRARITVGLAAALSDYLRAYGPWRQALALHWAALKAAVDTRDLPGQAEAYRGIGGVQSRTGDIGQSKDMQGKALAIYRELGDQQGAARVLIELGQAQRVAGDPECLDAFTEALDIYKQLDDLRGQAAALTELGSIRWQSGPIPEAEGNLLDALRIYRELGNRQGEAAALLYLGNVQLALGSLAAATTSLDKAEAIGRDLGQPVLVANSLLYKGDVQRAAGRLGDARESITSAHEIYTELSHRQGMATALTYLGETLTLAGEHEQADDLFGQALSMFGQLGDPNGMAEALNSHAALARASSRADLARARYVEALRQAGIAESARDKADALAGLAAMDAESGQTAPAVAGYTEALAIYQAMQSEADVARLRLILDGLGGAGAAGIPGAPGASGLAR